jgi:hypothetical protein
MTFEEMRDRYENDSLFHTLVGMLHTFLMQGKITVSELRDASTFAGYKFEIHQIRPIFDK